MGADGLKTGHTEDSGYGLVGSAVQEGRRLILVLNGLNSENERSTEAQRLLRIGFRDYAPYALLNAGDIVGQAAVWQGQRSNVALEIREPVTLVLRPEDRRNMKVSINYVGPVPAPIAAGEQVAELRIAIPGLDTRAIPLYAAETVQPLGFFGKLGAAVIHLIRGRLSGEDTQSQPEPAAAS